MCTDTFTVHLKYDTHRGLLELHVKKYQIFCYFGASFAYLMANRIHAVIQIACMKVDLELSASLIFQYLYKFARSYKTLSIHA